MRFTMLLILFLVVSCDTITEEDSTSAITATTVKCDLEIFATDTQVYPSSGGYEPKYDLSFQIFNNLGFDISSLTYFSLDGYISEDSIAPFRKFEWKDGDLSKSPTDINGNITNYGGLSSYNEFKDDEIRSFSMRIWTLNEKWIKFTVKYDKNIAEKKIKLIYW